MLPSPTYVDSVFIFSMKSEGTVAGKSLLFTLLKASLKLVGLLMSFGDTVRKTLAGPCRCVNAIDSETDVLFSMAPNPILRPDDDSTGKICDIMSAASLPFGLSIAFFREEANASDDIISPNFWKASGLAWTFVHIEMLAACMALLLIEKIEN